MYDSVSSINRTSLSRYSKIIFPPLNNGHSLSDSHFSNMSSNGKASPEVVWHNLNFCKIDNTEINIKICLRCKKCRMREEGARVKRRKKKKKNNPENVYHHHHHHWFTWAVDLLLSFLRLAKEAVKSTTLPILHLLQKNMGLLFSLFPFGKNTWK